MNQNKLIENALELAETYSIKMSGDWRDQTFSLRYKQESATSNYLGVCVPHSKEILTTIKPYLIDHLRTMDLYSERYIAKCSVYEFSLGNGGTFNKPTLTAKVLSQGVYAVVTIAILDEEALDILLGVVLGKVER